jgi:hypothetical protein
MSSMYGQATVGPQNPPSSDNSHVSDSDRVPDLAVQFIAEGVPQLWALSLTRAIQRTLKKLQDGDLTEDRAVEIIDRLAGSVFLAKKARVAA